MFSDTVTLDGRKHVRFLLTNIKKLTGHKPGLLEISGTTGRRECQSRVTVPTDISKLLLYSVCHFQTVLFFFWICYPYQVITITCTIEYNIKCNVKTLKGKNKEKLRRKQRFDCIKIINKKVN